MKPTSHCFDWAASFYDYTRVIPDDLMKNICELLKNEIQLNSSSRILEVGVGTGRMACALAKCLKVNFVGIDISEKMLHRCREKQTHRTQKVHLINADGYALPFSIRFDVIMTSHILHLVSDPFKLVNDFLISSSRYYINIDAFVNYHSTLPFQIYYKKLAEEGYRRISRGDLIRREVLIFLSNKGLEYSFHKLKSVKKMPMSNLVRFIRERVFSHLRLIEESLHLKALEFLYSEIEGQNIDLSNSIDIPANSYITIFPNINS
jgi:SAM-dependent methyltransferase